VGIWRVDFTSEKSVLGMTNNLPFTVFRKIQTIDHTVKKWLSVCWSVGLLVCWLVNVHDSGRSKRSRDLRFSPVDRDFGIDELISFWAGSAVTDRAPIPKTVFFLRFCLKNFFGMDFCASQPLQKLFVYWFLIKWVFVRARPPSSWTPYVKIKYF